MERRRWAQGLFSRRALYNRSSRDKKSYGRPEARHLSRVGVAPGLMLVLLISIGRCLRRPLASRSIWRFAEIRIDIYRVSSLGALARWAADALPRMAPSQFPRCGVWRPEANSIQPDQTQCGFPGRADPRMTGNENAPQTLCEPGWQGRTPASPNVRCLDERIDGAPTPKVE